MNETGTPGRRPTRSGRFLDAWPLLVSFLAASSLYVWQASKHPTPWLFSDEVEYAQIARAIAEKGRPARRGVEYWGAGLFPWLIAPFWWLGSLQAGYSAVKTFNALVMTAAIFPTYGLARTLMPRPYALLAGIGAVVAPSFIYTAMVMQEPVAYLVVAASFYLAARALADPTRRNLAAAAAIAVIAPFVRDQLILVPAIMIAAAACQYACFGGGRVRLAKTSNAGRAVVASAGVLVLVLGVLVARAGSYETEVALRSPQTMLDQAQWAWGSLAIGLGVLPVVIGLAMLVPSATIERTRFLAAFVSIFAVSIVLFTAYLSAKGAYEAAIFEPRIVERNLAYLTPLLWIALALFASTRVVQPWALSIAAAFTAWVIGSVPLRLEGLEADAAGLSILSRAKDDYDLGARGVQLILYGLVALAVLVALAPALLRHRRRVATWIVIGATILSIGWSLRAETVASRYSNEFSEQFYAGLPRPLDWIDQTTKGAPAVYIGQKIADPNGVWSMEFWNRDVRKVRSLDGSAPGPGPTLTPDLISTDGRLADDPGYRYAVIDGGLSIVGDTVAEQGAWKIVRIRSPLRLRESVSGVFADGWLGSTQPADSVTADYNRFDASARPGTVFVTVSRKNFCGGHAPGRVSIDVGTIKLGEQKHGELDRVTASQGWIVDSCAERTFPIPTPGGPFHVRITVAPPFQPVVLDPRLTERRYLGAVVRIAYDDPR